MENLPLGRFAESPATADASTGGAKDAPTRAGFTARALGMLTLGGVLMLAMVAGGVLTSASQGQYLALIVCMLAVWACWLFWRTVLGDPGVPVSLLHPFIGILIVLLIAHLLGGGRAESAHGRIDLIGKDDPGVLIRLMALALLILLVQDVLPRVRCSRWPLTAIGLAIAIGSVVRLASDGAVEGAAAVALSGFAGVGMLLSPVLLPWRHAEHSPPGKWAWLMYAETIARMAAAAALAGMIMVSHYQGADAAVLATGAVAAALILSGVFLRHHRLRLLSAGAVLAAAAAVGAMRLALPPLRWVQNVSLLGSSQPSEFAAAGDLSGLAAIALTTGWVGAGILLAGMLATLTWSLLRAQAASPGDQARSALWAAVAAVGAAALLAEGGLAVPAAVATAAVAWGLLPHMMAHHLGRFKGWGVTLVFLAGLAVLGLETRVGAGPWLKSPADAYLHAAGTALLAAFILWRTRCRKWWHGLLAAAVAAGLTSLGELAQRYLSTVRSPQWDDVTADWAGAAAALAVFFVILIATRIERAFAAKPKIDRDKYRSWQAP